MCLYALSNLDSLAAALARSVRRCVNELPALALDFGGFLLLLPGVLAGARS